MLDAIFSGSYVFKTSLHYKVYMVDTYIKCFLSNGIFLYDTSLQNSDLDWIIHASEDHAKNSPNLKSFTPQCFLINKPTQSAL